MAPPQVQTSGYQSWRYTAASLAITAVGLALRVEHMLTYPPSRAADYDAYLRGVRWVLENGTTFDAGAVSLQVGCHTPFWYVLGALIVGAGLPVRAIAGVSVLGFLGRHYLLGRMLREAAPDAVGSRLIALALQAVLPFSVLMDGKVNPEGLHALLFTTALYLLWRLERQARASESGALSAGTAALFGVAAGFAFLTKATSIVLVLAALVFFAWHLVDRWRRSGPAAACRATGAAVLPVALAWTLTTAWWTAPNLERFGHPFPHCYEVAHPALAIRLPVLREPALYRRPLGWYLPFDAGYLHYPIAVDPQTPAPNFWTPVLAGTWTDYLNRGFCRLKGGGEYRQVWGAWAGPEWHTTGDCFRIMGLMVRVGLVLSALAVAACAWLLGRFLRSGGRQGSLVLPAANALVVVFTMAFAVVYPLDGDAVVKPNYLLAMATPMVACLGLLLARLEGRRHRMTLLHIVTATAVGIIGLCTTVERWWVF